MYGFFLNRNIFDLKKKMMISEEYINKWIYTTVALGLKC